MPFFVLAGAVFSLYAQRRAVFSHLDEEDVHFMGQLCHVHVLKVKMQTVQTVNTFLSHVTNKTEYISVTHKKLYISLVLCQF